MYLAKLGLKTILLFIAVHYRSLFTRTLLYSCIELMPNEMTKEF